MSDKVECKVYCNNVSHIMSCNDEFACMCHMNERDLQFRYAIDMFKPIAWNKMMRSLKVNSCFESFKTKLKRPNSDRTVDVAVRGECTDDGYVLIIDPLSTHVPKKIKPLKLGDVFTKKKYNARTPVFETDVKTIVIDGKLFKYRQEVIG